MKNNTRRKHIGAYQILGIALLCLALFMFTYNATTSWFKDESVTSNGKPNITVIGTLSLDVTTNFNFYNLALAPDTTYTKDKDNQDIGTYIKIASDHNIDGAYVRVQFACNREELSLTFAEDSLATSETGDKGNKWIYNENDDYYYYIGYIGVGDTRFNAGYYIDNTLNNSKANANVDIVIKVEAIQRQNGASGAVWTSSPEAFKSFVLSDEKLFHGANGTKENL